MLSEEIKSKIQLIQIKTRRKLNALLLSNSNSKTKGSGYDFDQIREYTPGDDIRFLDFKSSARMGKLFVRQYLEERNRTIIILVDVSASNLFSSCKKLKHEIIAEISSVIAMAANHCNDRVGIALFTDSIVKFIPPNKGNIHIDYIMDQLFIFDSQNGSTNIDIVLKDWMKKNKKQCIVFLVSDFIDTHSFERAITLVSNYSELIAVKYNDKMESNLAVGGLLNLQDIETGENLCLDVSNHRKTEKINKDIENYFIGQQKLFKKYKVDLLNITNSENCISDIIKFFNKRLMY